ncbi:MAG TPA: hypothetical protein PLC76_03365 [Saprospiraceae bacterium]|nr:hypothetical protein [Saprospiraceae bacterium]HRP83736.1 hypothetical protein [Saprospiraceae bacterium]
MAKFNKSERVKTQKVITAPIPGSDADKLGNLIPTRLMPFLIVVFAILFYANSLGGSYVMDDAIVISENQFTIQGVAGWKGIFSHDTFYGFFRESGKNHLVSGGRYRPLSLALFALEGQVFGFKPFVFHLFNLLYYALTCFLLFRLFHYLFESRYGRTNATLIAFFCSLLFTVHPIHTEVVANIKGRDEILTCLLGLAGTWYFIRSIDRGRLALSILAAFLWFLSLLAKENGIVFIALAPLAVWFFKDVKMSDILRYSIPAVVMTILYLILRRTVLGPAPDSGPIMELMNNPFLTWHINGYLPVTFSIKLATIAVTMLKYILLLIYPYQLTSDYYPQQIPLSDWSNWRAILGFLLYATAIVICLIRLKKKEIITFGILFYLVALFPMSNILFPVGTLMSERFLFIPSIGFALIISRLIHIYVVKGSLNSRLNLLILALILILSVKTIARNKDWSDNYTLFTTDVKISDNSAKMLNAAGGALLDSCIRVKDPIVKKQMAEEAQRYLLRAIELHPSYSNAYLLLGNSYAYTDNLEKAAENYQLALQYNQNFMDAKINLASMYKELGRKAGEKEGNLPKAKEMLGKSLQLNPKDPETNRLLGIAIGMSGDPKGALIYFKAALEAKPDDAFYMFDLGSAYANAGDMEKANYYHAEAIKKDPSLQQRLNK